MLLSDYLGIGYELDENGILILFLIKTATFL